MKLINKFAKSIIGGVLSMFVVLLLLSLHGAIVEIPWVLNPALMLFHLLAPNHWDVFDILFSVFFAFGVLCTIVTKKTYWAIVFWSILVIVWCWVGLRLTSLLNML